MASDGDYLTMEWMMFLRDGAEISRQKLNKIPILARRLESSALENSRIEPQADYRIFVDGNVNFILIYFNLL